MFLDPLYYLENKSKLDGNNGDLHKLLFDLLKQMIITYNNRKYIRNLYKDYLIFDVNWSYGMNICKNPQKLL